MNIFEYVQPLTAVESVWANEFVRNVTVKRNDKILLRGVKVFIKSVLNELIRVKMNVIY